MKLLDEGLPITMNPGCAQALPGAIASTAHVSGKEDNMHWMDTDWITTKMCKTFFNLYGQSMCKITII